MRHNYFSFSSRLSRIKVFSGIIKDVSITCSITPVVPWHKTPLIDGIIIKKTRQLSSFIDNKKNMRF